MSSGVCVAFAANGTWDAKEKRKRDIDRNGAAVGARKKGIISCSWRQRRNGFNLQPRVPNLINLPFICRKMMRVVWSFLPACLSPKHSSDAKKKRRENYTNVCDDAFCKAGRCFEWSFHLSLFFFIFPFPTNVLWLFPVCVPIDFAVFSSLRSLNRLILLFGALWVVLIGLGVF